MDDTEFLKHLHDEKLKAEEARTTFTLQKLAFATALLGIGSLNIRVGQIDLQSLLYLVPWVALAFDFYILGEDYSVKRFGAFLGASSPNVLEQRWEKWVSRNRDPFAPVAMPILTTLLLLSAATIMWIAGSAVSPVFWVWLVVTSLSTWTLFAFYRRLRERAIGSARLVAGEPPQPSRPVQHLRSTVENADYLIDGATYREVRNLFATCMTNVDCLENLQGLSPEYGKSEFLLCVNHEGSPVYPPPDVFKDFKDMVSRHPSFGLWFQEASTGEGEQPVLLAARWLCHLVGFRHRSVHLFIDHPTLDDHTLIQVRGTGKFEAPGRFDLPVAGHVVGLELPADALFKELEEELNLDRDDVDDLRQIGGYDYCEPSSNLVLRNVEFRVVFTSRLKHDRLPKIRFVDGEVAGLSVFKLSELKAMISHFPERVASGLEKSFSVYMGSKNG